MHLWVRFLTGLISGCWVGVFIGCAVTVVLMGKRMRQLQSANLALRLRLRARARPRPATVGTGPLLVRPFRETNRPASAPMARAAFGGR